jgi:hypothetical protein
MGGFAKTLAVGVVVVMVVVLCLFFPTGILVVCSLCAGLSNTRGMRTSARTCTILLQAGATY